MAFSSKSNNKYHVRSTSLPCRSYTSERIEEHLQKIRTWELLSSCKPSANTICNRLSGLAKLYERVDDLLNSLVTQNSFPHTQDEKRLTTLLDGSVVFLDICWNTKDTMSKLREQVRGLQCALRRRKGDPCIKTSILKYTSLRKKIKRDAKEMVAALRQHRTKRGDLDDNLTAVLKEVNEMTSLTFESLLRFFSMPALKPKQSRWQLASKLIHKGTVGCEEAQQVTVNELESLDATLLDLHSYCSVDDNKILMAQNKLVALEACIGSIESGLECVFRRLIKTRVSLLNIISKSSSF